MSEPARSYRFHPLERRGLLLGLGAAQLLVVGVGAVDTVVVLRAGGGLVPAVLVLLVAAGIAGLPVAGATPLQWLPLVVSWVARRAECSAPPGRSVPPPGIALRAAPEVPGEPALGVVRDRRSGAWAAVVPVTAPAFTLLDVEDKRRKLAAWGAVLDSTARPSSPIYRVQWLERTLPADTGMLHAHLDETVGPTGGVGPAAGGGSGRRDGPAGRGAGYRDLLGAASSGASHEVLLVVSVHPRSAGRQLRAFGHGPAAVCSLLRRELRLLAGQLRRSELEPGVPLDLPALAAAVRLGCDPLARRSRSGTDRSAWPTAWDDGWSCARIDGRWQATYWVAEWPRREVGPDFLLPLLLTSVPRVVSVTMAPVPAKAAVREVETARTAELADEELRRRAGFLATARHRRRAEGVANREAELADGHGELRFAGYVGVSGSTPEQLDDAAATVEAAAQQCGLELRRLYGRQVEAFSWTLPIGRGLG